mmetsp:Transcript_16160/g.34114  ORF Transcript_16160/g.34114 Transcript_16160/m.34114 type:complete len:584 (-) Transcript_16160:47-1798(-)|eukprot:CAMPEP_0183719738 /NCGR_PEP_ID=MMETSP0737-20130205/12554_1 /TAXON_ID=385413 /ORGANISM="Thalassiosira miniscula, Strain CCMP1093" /LENGTH=583 /DNA_ID=CAMNT_0025949477 /DNA_START=196 /DNA_END=1947 /DNA_ORIENTATION=-
MANKTDQTDVLAPALPPPGEAGVGAGEAKAKRQKISNGCMRNTEDAGPNGPIHISCSQGRMPHDCKATEFVLHLPPRLTKSSYQTLLACDTVPRQWHLEGRFGSRTHKIDKSINGIPVLFNEKIMRERSLASPELKQLLDTEGVSIVEKEFVHNHRTRQEVPILDARIHPELEPDGFVLPSLAPKCMDSKSGKESPDFTYAEMFGGIGGFGVALESLGGKCAFYSEIDEHCRETYSLNFDTPSNCIHGDIYTVPDEAFPKDLDLLVAGFPCQPFSNLGEQPGFNCEKGRGQLYLQIVRALELSQPKAFLFENVPGLLGMEDTLSIIVDAFRGPGYHVTGEICSARGLTATSRKRLFFVGIRKDLVSPNSPENAQAETESKNSTSSPFDRSFYQFPYVPDLKICSHDILDYDSLPQTELDILRLSKSTWNQLAKNSRWKPTHLAWPNRQCDTLTSHYGNAVGRGESQLVPSLAPHLPRRFSVRECARIMGFPNTFKFCDIRTGQGDMAHRKEQYRMIGNAVCPPLIAALAGKILDAAGVHIRKGTYHVNWRVTGHHVAVELSCAALRSSPVTLPVGCLISNNDK